MNTTKGSSWSSSEELIAFRVAVKILAEKSQLSEADKQRAYALFCEAVGNQQRTQRSFLERVGLRSGLKTSRNALPPTPQSSERIRPPHQSKRARSLIDNDAIEEKKPKKKKTNRILWPDNSRSQPVTLSDSENEHQNHIREVIPVNQVTPSTRPLTPSSIARPLLISESPVPSSQSSRSPPLVQSSPLKQSNEVSTLTGSKTNRSLSTAADSGKDGGTAKREGRDEKVSSTRKGKPAESMHDSMIVEDDDDDEFEAECQLIERVRDN